MAQEVTVILEDDLTGGPADQTIRFAFEGTDYEIDLNAKFSRQLAPYGGHARRAGRAQSHCPGRTANRQRSGDVRAWAKEHGLAVSERRRIPASVVEQYNAAGGHLHKPQIRAEPQPRHVSGLCHGDRSAGGNAELSASAMSMPPERSLTLYQRASSGCKTSSGRRRVAVIKPAAGASTRNTPGRDGGCVAGCSSAIKCLHSPALQ